MNSSSFIDPSVLVQNSTITIAQSWFIPLDIFMILCCSLVILLGIFVLSIIISDKTCYAVPMLLIFNSYLTALTIGCSALSLAIVTLQNDLEQIQYEDSLCVLRGYIIYSATTAYYYSFALQALYRYLIAIYPTRLLFQSFRFHILTICSSWLFCVAYPFVFLFAGSIIYSVDNQICLVPLSFSFSTIYLISCLFFCPTSITMNIYFKLILYVRQMGRNVAAANTLIRAQRELKMVRRVVILITILTIICFPFTIMVLMGFFNHEPKYHARISFVFMDFSGLTGMIILFKFTDPLKESVMKRIKWRPNRIAPSLT